MYLAPRGTQPDRDDNVGDLNLPAIDGLCISVIDVAVHHTYGQNLSAHLIFADGAIHQFDETEIPGQVQLINVTMEVQMCRC